MSQKFFSSQIVERPPGKLVLSRDVGSPSGAFRRLEPLADVSPRVGSCISAANAYLDFLEKRCAQIGWENLCIVARPIKKQELDVVSGVLEMSYYSKTSLIGGFRSDESLIASKPTFEKRFQAWPSGFFIAVLADRRTGEEIGPVGYSTGCPTNLYISSSKSGAPAAISPAFKEWNASSPFVENGNAFHVFSTSSLIRGIGVQQLLIDATLLHAFYTDRTYRLADFPANMLHNQALDCGDDLLNFYARAGFKMLSTSSSSRETHVVLYRKLRESHQIRSGGKSVVISTDAKDFPVRDGVLPIYAGSVPELLSRELPAYAGPVAGKRVLDIGSGSGILSISAALHGASHVVAVDINPRAVRTTIKNARNAGVSVDARLGSYLAPITDSERFDIIISNPPFVATPPNPRAAIHTGGGQDGADPLRHILEGSYQKLASEGKIVLYMLSLKKGPVSVIEEAIRESSLFKECKTLLFQCHSEDYLIADFFREFENYPGYSAWRSKLLESGVTGLQRYLVVMHRVSPDDQSAGTVQTILDGDGLLGKTWSRDQNVSLFTGWLETL